MAITKISLGRQTDLNANSNQITNVVDPTSAQMAATKNYVDSVAAGLSPKASVHVATTGSETFTIVSGSVTQITGTTIDGVSPSVGDRILIKDAPSATGTGSAYSNQAGNGIYTVTSNTTNLSVSRSTDMSGTNNPAGASTLAENGTTNGAKGFVVTTPAPGGAFTYGTTTMQWTLYTISSGGTVTTVSVASANGFAGTVANASSTPQITVSTSITGVLKGNGTAISAATAGTDFMAPSDFVWSETPGGTVNGTNTAFTLANTPLAGSVRLHQNGLRLAVGGGADYTISGTAITFNTAPATGDVLLADYCK